MSGYLCESQYLDQSTQTPFYDDDLDNPKNKIPNKAALKRDKGQTDNLEAWKNLSLESKKDKDEKSKKVLKEVGLFALKTAAISTAVLGGIAIAVPAIGFGAAGVTAGSLAAAFQSTFLGGTIVSGSAFAVLQSVGAAGLAASSQAGIVAGSAAVAAATSARKLIKKDEEEKNKKNDKSNLKKPVSQHYMYKTKNTKLVSKQDASTQTYYLWYT